MDWPRLGNLASVHLAYQVGCDDEASCDEEQVLGVLGYARGLATPSEDRQGENGRKRENRQRPIGGLEIYALA